MLTMEDIAKLSGYSRVTVSAVFRNKPNVSEKARQKIMEVAKKHHYTPNAMAMTLKGKPSMLIGVVIRGFSNPYFAEILEGITEATHGTGYTLLTLNSEDNLEKERAALHTLASYQVDGLILCPVIEGSSFDHINLYLRHQKPIITFEQTPGMGLDYVDFEDRAAGEMAAEYLLAKGHRRIAFLRGPDTSHSSRERMAGFRRALNKAGIKRDPALEIPLNPHSIHGFESALEALDLAERPSALCCFSDLVAIGAYKAAHKLGLSIPEDISIIGFDGVDLGTVLGPSLTSVGFDIRNVGRFVGQRIIENIEGEQVRSGLAEVFKPKLYERGSVGAPKAQEAPVLTAKVS